MKSINSLAKLALQDAIKSKASPSTAPKNSKGSAIKVPNPSSYRKGKPPGGTSSKDPMHQDEENMAKDVEHFTCPNCGHLGSKDEFEE